MSNVSCGLDNPVFTLGQQCSGNGLCVYDSTLERGVCQCFPGWSGFADFQVTSSLTDCEINDTLLRVLWAINLAESVGLFIPTALLYSKLYRKHQRTQQEAKSRGVKYSFFQNKGLLASTPYVFGCFWFQAAFAIMKLVDPTMTIGMSWLATILWFLFRFAYYTCGVIFQPNLLESMLKSQKNLDHVIRNNYRASRIHYFFAVCGSITAIPVNAIPVSNVFYPISGLSAIGVYLLVHSTAFGFLCFQCKYLEIKVSKILEHSYTLTKDERTKRIRDKLTTVQNQFFKQTFLQFFIYLVFGVLPFTWRFHQYLLVFTWMFPPLSGYQLLKSIYHDETAASSSQKGSVTGQANSSDGRVVVKVDQVSSDINDEDRPKHIHGLDLDPIPKSGLNTTTTSDEYGSAATENANRVGAPKQSSAMKLLSALTPSRKKNNGDKFGFEDMEKKEGNGE